jgi:predicted membrane protein
MHNTRRICWGALFIALGILLPITFHMVGMGKVFLPMHIPILLAGFFCGPAIGAMVGFITPLLSAVMTGMPPFMPPTAQIMVFELAAYGLLTGLLFNRFRLGVYPSLLLAMLAGRAVHGLVGYLIMPVFGLEFSVLYPLTYGLLSGLPGIILQLAFVPGVIILVERNAAVLLKGKEALAER